MKPTQIIVITGDTEKGLNILNQLKDRNYAVKLITGFGNISKGWLYGVDHENKGRSFPVERFGLAFVDQRTANGFVPICRSGKRIVSLLHLLMPCVAICGDAANNEKLINVGATYQLGQDELPSFIEDSLPTLVPRKRRRKPVAKALTGS